MNITMSSEVYAIHNVFNPPHYSGKILFFIQNNKHLYKKKILT